ncbi:MAG: hypothetical protein WA646_09415, partial [Candidatus Sulfotelmatobacter sp.]
MTKSVTSGTVGRREEGLKGPVKAGKGLGQDQDKDNDLMRPNLATVLDPNRRSADAGEFEAALRRRIVGQDQAVEKVAEIYQMFLAGLNAP